ncbi:methyl-accepting chemotaxis protein [Aquimonas voraii]|uniref:Methyl-accepting chemotaxis protein n=1 Tax=Aquimonas voraii TaxID=265719 RepID=A0A1G6XYU6_9GAMM|nr:methyl-accepting chemotaxis protein [Aquimonas voraii]SDD82565.1 methyl-accepting chemotaxis protein [Aquimonas voraii]
MSKLHNLRIWQRLALGFGLVIALMLTLTAVGVERVGQIERALSTINQLNSVKQRYAINFRGSVHDRAISLRDVVLFDAESDVDAAGREIDRLAAFYADSAAPLDALVMNEDTGDHEERAILDSIKAIENQTLPLIVEVRRLRAAGEREAAHALLLAEAKPAFETWLARINQFIDLQEARNGVEAKKATATAEGFAQLMVLLSALAIGLGSLVAWRIVRSVTKPLNQAVQVAQRVGEGDLGSIIGQTRGDETGQLLQAMRRMQEQLQRFTEAQEELAARHARGELGFRIEASQFPGVYGRMAEGVNSVLGSSIKVSLDMLDLVDAYARGDFSRDMARLPGDMARISASMDGAKASLVEFSAEVKRLASAAAAGDFSARGAAERFAFSYREMVQDLNTLMQTADANLAEISRLLGALASGDLTASMQGNFAGVFARIRDDANRSVANIRSIVAGIVERADSIRVATGEITAGVDDLSSRTEAQAGNLEATTHALTDLTQTVRRNADRAREANQLAQGAGSVAQSGGQVVGEVISTMDSISESSRRIADIISVIDGIAFQTNILALNAAVEAARAGEQGRGFAVVASEVRSLAQRSAEAAKQIKGLIDDSSHRVELGAELVARAGTTMQDIMGAVQRVTDIMGEISAASIEQSSGIEGMGETMQALDQATQQNAALVEEASAAANSLQDHARALQEAVAGFRLGGEPSLRRAA